MNSYVEGFVRGEVGWDQEAHHTKVDMHEWMRRMAPHARELVATGKYPRFARLLAETVAPHLAPDQRFRYGLDRVLDTIAASLPDPGRPVIDPLPQE